MKLFRTLTLCMLACVFPQDIFCQLVFHPTKGDLVPSHQSVVATPSTKSLTFCPLCLERPTVTVFHRSLRESVSGSERIVDFRAIVPFPDRNPARAYVGRWFIPLGFIAATNLWIIDAGTFTDVVNNLAGLIGTSYEWAIVTAGRPNREGENSTCYSRDGM